jgi:hypothetical protein
MSESLIVREAQKQSGGDRVASPPSRAAWRDIFEEHNKVRAAAGERLRATIRGILAQHEGATPLRAREVRRALRALDLGREQLPSLRCVQWHLTAIREEAKLSPPPEDP